MSAVILVLLLGIVSGSDWGYSGAGAPGNWATLKQEYGACDDSAQSPIDIPGDSSSVKFDENLAPINVSGTSGALLQLVNNGHTVQLNILGNVMVSGGMLPNKFQVAQLHFHWGLDNNEGSEHTRGGSQYPLEMHVVSYNMKYNNLSFAADKSDGLAVLGFWFSVSDTDNAKFSTLFTDVSKVMYADEEASVMINLADLFPASLSNYFRYKGSLTTPPCFESITWTVFDDPLPISEKQLNLFRGVYENTKSDTNKHKIGHNYRPVQQLNGRAITRSFKSGASSLHVTSSILTIMVVLLFNYM